MKKPLKVSRNLVMFMVVVFSLFTLAGCNGRHKIYKEGFFQYIIVGENSRFPNKQNKAVVAIVGFTELGLEQEVIDFPRVIAKKEVRSIGYPTKGLGLDGGGSYVVGSQNLKKAYIHDNIKLIIFGYYDYIEMMICAARNYSVGENEVSNSGHVFVYKSVYDSLNEKGSKGVEGGWTWFKVAVKPASISFLNNYSDEINGGYYRLDNINDEDKIPEPPKPERDGYDFTGWYLEPSCATTWDFNNVKEITESEEFRLYAGWQEK